MAGFTEQERVKGFALFDEDASTNQVAQQVFNKNYGKAKKLREEWEEAQQPVDARMLRDGEPSSAYASDESRVKLMVHPNIAAAMQFYGSKLFAIVRVDRSTAKDGQADAVVISDSFATEEQGWTDARIRLLEKLGGAE